MTRRMEGGSAELGRGSSRIRRNPGYIATALVLIFGSCAALSIDVVRSGFGIKGDEATYVAMAMSAAYDADLAYESRDIQRFFRVYQGGPSGIFLKRGAGEHDRRNRLYFGKAFIYSVLAAPFVRIAGLNGMLLFHVLLLAGMLLAAYVFLAARSPGGIALAYSAAFFGVSIVPLHALFLSSDFFNVASRGVRVFPMVLQGRRPAGIRPLGGVAARAGLGHRRRGGSGTCDVLEADPCLPDPPAAGPGPQSTPAAPGRLRRRGVRDDRCSGFRHQRGDHR